MRLQHASLSFNEQGTPQSKVFDDVYFSNESGIAESEYVFIQGNALLETWISWQEPCFYIAETGFGTGLNFLCTMRLFEAFLNAHPESPLKCLHYISFEKFPIEQETLTTIHANWPTLASYSKSLLSSYPPPLEGLHRSVHSVSQDQTTKAKTAASGNITLDLVLGDAAHQLTQTHAPNGGFINAWYLDGFAPNKNDSMWEQSVYEQMARLSANEATLATFTAAGAVKRGLEKAGFVVQKIKGFGRKREMITACLSSQCDLHLTAFAKLQAPYFKRKAASSIQHIAVVGAGIAGALLALRLIQQADKQQGIKVTLICKDNAPACGASGNPIAGFYPQLNAEAGINSQFFVHAFLYARRFYDDLLQQGIAFEHDFCSVLQLAFNENTQTRLNKMRDKSLWPEALARIVNAQQASAIAGLDIPYSALHLPQGGWIHPVSLIHSVLERAQQSGMLTQLYEHEMLAYKSDSKGVELTLADQHKREHKHQYDALVIAAGAESMSVSQQPLPVRLTRGQVEAFPASKGTKALKTVLCHKGYFTPEVDGKHALGSTYVKTSDVNISTEHQQQEVQQNLNMHAQAMQQCSWVGEFEDIDVSSIDGRAAIRCSTPDHLPIVGAMPKVASQQQELASLYKALPLHRCPEVSHVDNVYLLTGLGSRGITSSPILVDTLVTQMLGKPLPMQADLLEALMPNRFLVRSLIRQTPYLA